MLNASYNLNLRKVNAHIPEYPVGIAPEIADMIKDFIPVAEARRRIEEAQKVGKYGSCWICGKVFTATDYECKHDFDKG